MGMMNLIICGMAAICLLFSGSPCQAESSSAVHNMTTVTTTVSWVPSPSLEPHDDSHGVSDDDETDDRDDDYHTGDDESSPPAGDGDDEKYPNPRKHPKICGLGDDPAWLCNKDDILDEQKANDLNKLLESLVEASEICPCQDVSCSYTGLPMFVIVLDTIPDYQNESSKHKEEHVRRLASGLLHDWESNLCDNGAMTVVVASDRIVVTVIGQASESLLSGNCQNLVENATFSFFEEGRVGEGLTELIQQYRSVALKSHPCNSDTHLKTSIIVPIIVVIALIIVAAVTAAVLLIYRRRGSKDIGTEANVPLKDQQQAEKA